MTPSVADFGVYIHVPFCSRRCDYCAFATFTDRDHLQVAYLDAVRSDIERADLPPATSVFVGGGTPTAVDPALLAAVIRTIPSVPGAEITWTTVASPGDAPAIAETASTSSDAICAAAS